MSLTRTTGHQTHEQSQRGTGAAHPTGWPWSAGTSSAGPFCSTTSMIEMSCAYTSFVSKQEPW